MHTGRNCMSDPSPHRLQRHAGAYAGLRAAGVKADLALVVADKDAVVGGTFTTNVLCAAPVLYCRDVMKNKKTVRAVRVPGGRHVACGGVCFGIRSAVCALVCAEGRV